MSTKNKRKHRGRSNQLCQLSAAAILFLLAMPWAVSAATIRVNTFEDELNEDGDCSLREAITSANRRLKTDACVIGTGRDLIVLPGGTYTLRTIDNDTDGPNGLPSILRTMSISAAAGSTAIIQRADDAPLFRILHTVASLGLFDVVLAGGDAGTGEGGGLFNAGSITVLFNTVIRGNKATTGGGIFNSDNVFLLLEGVTVEHNRSVGGSGGGIINNGLLMVTASTIRNNMTESTGGRGTGGGGILNQGGAMTIEGSSVIGNSSQGGAGLGGGGIRNDQGTLTITNSTISENESIPGNGRGGGINNTAAILNLNNVTITKNRAQIAGGGISNATVGSSVGTVNLKNTIIAGNTSERNGRDDCSGVFTSLGVNLIQEITNCTINGGTVVSADPRLGPLANNGGFTLNHILLANSDAIDKGSQAGPGSGGDACERRDQRGVMRPEDGDNTSGAICVSAQSRSNFHRRDRLVIFRSASSLARRRLRLYRPRRAVRRPAFLPENLTSAQGSEI
jgi:CSLREA domain-containing protein